MARILVVMPYVPWPADSGGTLRTLRLLEVLDAAHDVTALAADLRGADPNPLRARLRGRLHVVRPGLNDRARDVARVAAGAPLRYGLYAGGAMRRALEVVLGSWRPEIVHLDHLHTAPLAPVVRRFAPRVPLVLDEHNVESRLLARLAECEGGPRGRLLALHSRAVERLERAAVRSADLVLCCSQRDALELRGLGARTLAVVPNGADLPEPAPLAPESRDVVFVGSLDWRPNVLAALELAREIWPEVARRAPGTRLVLVGRNPPPEVRNLAGEDVVVTGTVPSVAPWLAGAFASAIPLRAGSGTRLKVLEAAAAGVPIVATELAFEGLPFAHDRDILVAETPGEFVEALVRLRSDAPLRGRIAAAALRTTMPFAWSSVGARLCRLYEAVLGRAEFGIGLGAPLRA